MLKVIQRVDPLSCAKMLGLVYGLFAVIFFPLMMLAGNSGAAGKEPMPWSVSLILMLIYPLVAFLMGAVAAWSYNLFASWVGGIRIELADE